jgi:hypothetical protein
MSDIKTVCLGTSNSLRYPQGGHLWVFLNWAAGFRAHGCRILWLDVIEPTDTGESLQHKIAKLKSRITPHGLADSIVLVQPDGTPLEHRTDCLDLEEAISADLLFDLRYDFPESLVKRLPRTALLDIDPGILQVAMKRKDLTPARHDIYFTIGETVGQPGSRIPSLGIDWVHVPPCVSTELWPATPIPSDGAFTTVSHWYTGDWMVDDDGSFYENDKRSAYLPFLELPKRVRAPLELAIHLAGDPVEREVLESHGWHVKEAHDVAGSPADFQRYIQSSRGEFSCVKPAYVKMLTSWISDRTLCYLASGRPAIIQDTGPTRYCSGHEGVLRFRDLEGAIECFEAIESDYSAHSAAARALAEQHFSASKAAAAVLDRCSRQRCR